MEHTGTTAGPATGGKPAGPPPTGQPPTERPPPSRPIEPPPEGTLSANGSVPGDIEEPCGPNDQCKPGLTCIAYYGFAGPRGPRFKSCEIRCKDKSDCPKGRTCVVVSDGPGAVCR